MSTGNHTRWPDGHHFACPPGYQIVLPFTGPRRFYRNGIRVTPDEYKRDLVRFHAADSAE